MREAEATLLAKKRAKVAAQMLESAADFFAMKTTGAGIIVTLDSITCEEGALQFQCSEADLSLA